MKAILSVLLPENRVNYYLFTVDYLPAILAVCSSAPLLLFINLLSMNTALGSTNHHCLIETRAFILPGREQALSPERKLFW